MAPKGGNKKIEEMDQASSGLKPIKDAKVSGVRLIHSLQRGGSALCAKFFCQAGHASKA